MNHLVSNNRPIDAICVGTAVIDLLFRGVPWDKIGQQEMLYVEDSGIAVGGDATNEAKLLARLGHRVQVAARIGDDCFGEIYCSQMKQHGVDLSMVRIIPDSITCASAVMIEKNGERCFVTGSGETNVTRFSIDDVDVTAFDRARIVTFGSLFVHPNFSVEDSAKLLAAAKSAGAITVADISIAAGYTSEYLTEILPHVDYFLPNEEEARFYSAKNSAEECAKTFVEQGAGCAVIKCGKNGCIIADSKGTQEVRGYPTEAIDTTGAGDTFVGAFVSGLLQGLDPVDCVKFANAAASISVKHLGACAGVESIEQVNQIWRQ